MERDKYKRLALLQAQLQRQRQAATAQRWGITADEAGEVFDILHSVGGTELIEQIFNFQTTGVFGYEFINSRI